MNLPKIYYTAKLETNNQPVTPGKKSSQYVPLFVAMSDFLYNGQIAYNNSFFSYAYEHMQYDYNSDMAGRFNRKLNNKLLNSFQFNIVNKIKSIRNQSIAHIKSVVTSQYNIAINWIFSDKIDFFIPNYTYAGSSRWDDLKCAFMDGGTGYLRKFTFVEQAFEGHYGYVGEINNRIHNPMVCLMVKRENIPFVRANWLLGIDIPDGIVEAWVLDTLDTPGYPKQSIRKSFKENILSEITNLNIPVIKKTREELDAIWFHYQEPKFKTVAERQAWLNKTTREFLKSERARLGIKEKTKFSFGSVKTGLKPVVAEPPKTITKVKKMTANGLLQPVEDLSPSQVEALISGLTGSSSSRTPNIDESYTLQREYPPNTSQAIIELNERILRERRSRDHDDSPF